MKKNNSRWYGIAIIIGLVAGGSALTDAANPLVVAVNIPEPVSGTSNNCPSPLAGCNVYSTYVSTIDPFCCSENVTTCTNYQVQTWTCAAGATRYRYFSADSPSLVGYNCGSSGCY